MTIFILGIVPAILLGAKLFGLYDRDELVVHKTTIDEAPAVVGMAALSWSHGSPGTRLLARRSRTRRDCPLAGAARRCCWAGAVRASARGRHARAQPADRRATASACARSSDVGRGAHRRAARPDRSTRRTSSAELAQLVSNLRVERLIIVPDHPNTAVMLDLVRARRASACASRWSRASSRSSARRSCSTTSAACRCSACAASASAAPRGRSSARFDLVGAARRR